MSTEIIKDTNRLLRDSEPVLRFLNEVDIEQVRANTEVDWERGLVLRVQKNLRELLLKMGYVRELGSDQLSFEQKGKAFLGKLLLDLDHRLTAGVRVDQRYILDSLLASGKNSLTFRADDTRLGRSVVLKFFRPGRGEGIIQNISRLGRVANEPILVNPLDVLRFSLKDRHEHEVMLDTLVFPYIQGMTLRQYLDRERNSSPVTIQAFIEQTCAAMMALQQAGLAHGDLHPNNVLVTTGTDGRAAFRIIDVSYGADEPSDYEYALDDMESFKLILRIALSDVQSRLTRVSLRRLLGARVFSLVEYILESSSLTFEHICRETKDARQFSMFLERRSEFLKNKFSSPRDFGILRYEEFSDPNVAIELFYPYPLLFERLREFGNAVLFGHRGTGKSTYMAAMNFFPQVDRMPVDFRKHFGILFSCRQGEFRKFSHDYITKASSRETKLYIKDILITKIMRKTLRALTEGIHRNRLAAPGSLGPIADLVAERLQHTPGLMVSHQLSEPESINATILQAEINLIDALLGSNSDRPASRLLDEDALMKFFEAVRKTFTELGETRFSILFDDAGRPNVPTEVQSIICDLMASTNQLFCVKLSAEKKTFELITSDKKPIERIHDVRVYTISDYLNMGSGFDTSHRDSEEYFRNLVGVRLKVAGFNGHDIRLYLGEDGLPKEQLLHRLVNTRGKRVKYFGWKTIWQIADRTLRHLIEMISAIFDDAKVTARAPAAMIPAHVQSREIVRFSNDKLRGLMFLPGTILLQQKHRPLGKMLYEYAATFGRIARYYLEASAKHGDGNPRRYDQRLAIEVDNTLNLHVDAQRMLDALIQYAVIDDEKWVTALDDNARKPVYIFNRVYCPVLRISFDRFDHWRLSSKRFEKLLLDPAEFIRSDPHLKGALRKNEISDNELFNF